MIFSIRTKYETENREMSPRESFSRNIYLKKMETAFRSVSLIYSFIRNTFINKIPLEKYNYTICIKQLQTKLSDL